MPDYKIVLTWESIYDVAEIAEYIEDKFSQEKADEFQENIQKEFCKITTNAKLYQKTYILYRGYDIYKKIFKPSLIFYLVKEEDKEIHILRVLREERDWGNILKTTDNYTYPE